MKTQQILFLIIGFFLIGSCKETDKLTQFNMEYTETITVPASTGISLPFNILTPDVETNSSSTFANNDTKKELIESVILTNLDLTLTSPDGEDFSFLKSIEIYLTAEGLSEIKIAWKNDIPNDAGNSLELETNENDLKEYIKKDKFSLRVNTTTDEILKSDHKIDVHTIFFVDAKILGL